MFKRQVSSFLAGVGMLLALWSGQAARAGETGAPDKVERKGPLAALPSAPGPTVEKVKALGDNQWVNLGSPAGDPKWGRARGCSWGAKAFALAPELRGAFFTGEGVHAFVKPNGFGMDDYWFYDLNAHRWICLYPGTDTKNFNQKVKDKELTVDDNGQVVDKDGQPIPGHLLIHAWGFLTYDTDQRKFVMFAGDSFGTYFMPGLDSVKEGITSLAEQAKTKKRPPAFTPWAYDSVTGKFERYAAGNPGIDVGGFPQFLYASSRKQHFVAGGNGVAYYDPAKRAWTVPKSQGPRPPGYDQRGCYDSKRDRAYIGGGIIEGKGMDQGFYVYDLKAETWTKPEVAKETYPSGCRIVHYDSVNDAVVMMHTDKKLYAYHPETSTWDEPVPIPGGLFAAECRSAFYDPELNAHFVFVAGDSADNGTMWAYRYKKAPEKK
jgi:hypothetical protein